MLLNSRKQRVVLHWQYSFWTNVEAGVLQGSILASLLFLICVNNLPEKLITNPILLVDDTSLFSVVHDIQKI